MACGCELEFLRAVYRANEADQRPEYDEIIRLVLSGSDCDDDRVYELLRAIRAATTGEAHETARRLTPPGTYCCADD